MTTPDFLRCSLCSHPYNKPKSLPCLHSFCANCISAYIGINGVKATDGTLCIYCPRCRSLCDVPEVSSLPDDRLLCAAVDVVRGARRHCDTCTATSATWCCLRCEEFLCGRCVRDHKRQTSTSDHPTINITVMRDVCTGLRRSMETATRLALRFGKHDLDLYAPRALAVTRAGDAIVANGDSTISVFSPSGACRRVLDQRPFYNGVSCGRTMCVAVTHNGMLVVALRRIQSPFSLTVAIVQSLSGRLVGDCRLTTTAGSRCCPHGIAVGADIIAVTDIGRHRVYIFDSTTYRLRCAFGRHGSGRRRFRDPRYVAVTSDGSVVVSDCANRSVKIFDQRGTHKLTLGEKSNMQNCPLERSCSLEQPAGVCYDQSGRILVADRDNHRVVAYDATTGDWQGVVIDETFRGAGADIRPLDVATTPDGHIAVLLTGIEGVDYAGVHVYHCGLSPTGSASGKQLNAMRQSLDALNAALPPKGQKKKLAITGPSKLSLAQPTAPKAEELAKTNEQEEGTLKPETSSVCVIL